MADHMAVPGDENAGVSQAIMEIRDLLRERARGEQQTNDDHEVRQMIVEMREIVGEMRDLLEDIAASVSGEGE